ncbi:MAG: discoidin domain-containing protein [Myxococcales bacterium]|nr:discoidin domain-containing protein [Myxococcales bacterium]
MTGLARGLVERLLLRAAIERAQALPEMHAARARALGHAAVRRASAARALRAEEHDIAALRLAREAAELAIAALLAARGELPEELMAPPEPWARLAQLALPEPPTSLSRVREMFEPRDPIQLDSLTSSEARRARADASLVVDWLLEHAEPRTPRALRGARALRVVTLVGGLAGAVWFVLWAFVWPSNEAAYKPVAISSLQRGSAPSEAITDGERTKAVTTDRQEQPWVRVDLLNTVAIERVAVYAPDKSAVPLIVEISDDDAKFAEVAVRAEPISKGRWVAGLGKRRARYVRLRHPGAGALVFSEIEVWGKR